MYRSFEPLYVCLSDRRQQWQQQQQQGGGGAQGPTDTQALQQAEAQPRHWPGPDTRTLSGIEPLVPEFERFTFGFASLCHEYLRGREAKICTLTT